MKSLLLASILAIAGFTAVGQVNDIKEASKSNSKGKSSGGDSGRGGGSNINIFFVVDFFRFFGEWQKAVLDKADTVPGISNIELLANGAIQPSQYNIVNPRIRAKWGVFSTDARVNWLYEPSSKSSLTSFDWQVIQFNFLNTRHANLRWGLGFMQENFGEHDSFFESAITGSYEFPRTGWGTFAEMRWAKDFETDAVPRREFVLQAQRELTSQGAFHLYATGGLQFQRYYSSINVWGIQLGLVARFFKDKG